jgi:hypothetical protein
LATTRGKRWNGNFDTLPAEYLKSVLAKMLDYGESVQFSLMSGGPQPSYQIENTLGKKMAFDRNHHLLTPQDDEFVGVNASAVFTLDQIRAAIAGVRPASPARATRTARTAGGGAGTRTTAAQLNEQCAAKRYEYFKENRATLPAAISTHSDEIAELMIKGKPVEEAFSEIVKKYF